MDKERLMHIPGRKCAVWLYTIVMTKPFLFGVLAMFGVPDSVYYQDVFHVLYMLVMTGLVMYLWVNRPGEKRPLPAAFWVLTAGFLWIIVRFLFDRELFLQYNPEAIWNRAFEAWFLFFPCALLLTREELGRCIRVLTLVWGVGVGLAAMLGIYCAATNSRYYTPMGTIIGISEYDGVYRLWLSYYATISAENLLVAAIFTVLAMFTANRKWQKVCFGLLLVPIYVALGLTDGRSAMIAFGLLIAVAVFIRVLMLPLKQNLLRYGTALVAAVCTVVLVYGACGRISGFFHVDVDSLPGGRNRAAVLVQPESRILLAAGNYEAAPSEPRLSVLAEVPEQKEVVIHRQIEGTLSGRTELWSCALRAIANNDQNMLLVGKTPYGYEEVLRSYEFPEDLHHVHNTYLQVIMEWGLPGLVLMVAFLALLGISSVRLALHDGLPFWERFLPGPALALLAVELVDCFLRLGDTYVALQAGFLFMGMIIAVEQKNR